MEAKEAKNGPSIHYRLTEDPTDHPGDCDRCRARIVTRSGLIGTFDGRPLCEQCLLKTAPAVGWAFALAEAATSAAGGRWPTSAESGDLAGVLEWITASAEVLGPLRLDSHRLAMALGFYDVLKRHGRARPRASHARRSRSISPPGETASPNEA